MKRSLFLTIAFLAAATLFLWQAILQPPSVLSKKKETGPFTYLLEVPGQVTGTFSEMSHLGSAAEVVVHTVVDPSGNPIEIKIPGRLTWTDITLRRIVTSDTQLSEWRKLVEDSDVVNARADGQITIFDSTGNPIGIWQFERGWPSEITTRSDGDGLALEEITITHEGLVRAQ